MALLMIIDSVLNSIKCLYTHKQTKQKSEEKKNKPKKAKKNVYKKFH